MMGNAIFKSTRFAGIDYLIPLPLHAGKEFKRGYNQAEVLCRGIEKTSNIRLASRLLIRQKFTETQTKKHRVERWENVEDSFAVNDETVLQNKHILLVDDVVTTGATLESGANALRHIPGIRISIGTLAIAPK